MSMFSKRVWLNKDSSSSTGSVVAFHGETQWRSDKAEVTSFLEIADCHCKIRLHRAYSDSMGEFVEKLRKLSAVVSEFATFLETETGEPK